MNISQQEYAKAAIANLLCVHLSADPETAIDIVNQCQAEIDELLFGTHSQFKTIDEILFQYLGLHIEYKWVFVDEIMNDVGD